MSENHPLAKYRHGRRITQEALAKELGVTSVTVSRWETGERTPRFDVAKALAEKTGVPVLDFLEWKKSDETIAAEH
jgi:transcriptional regulator with XRE-family HTH domain